MMNSTILDKDDNYKFRGRKLILEWGNLKIELSKLPYGDRPKDPVFELCGSKVVLANVLEDPAGKLVDEILGPPAGFTGDGKNVEGRTIQDYFASNEYWMTPGEAQSGKYGV